MWVAQSQYGIEVNVVFTIVFQVNYIQEHGHKPKEIKGFLQGSQAWHSSSNGRWPKNAFCGGLSVGILRLFSPFRNTHSHLGSGFFTRLPEHTERSELYARGIERVLQGKVGMVGAHCSGVSSMEKSVHFSGLHPSLHLPYPK